MLRATRARFLAVFGPGLVVMLADSDVGSVITAGQSGVQWGYRLLGLQLLLMPILYIVQELTVRLGIFTGRGHGELIRATFGPVWASLSVATLAVATLGALLTEFAGVAGVGELYGLPRTATLPVAAIGLLGVMVTRSYRSVERAAIAIGLFELAFFIVAWTARPDIHAILRDSLDIAHGDPDYVYLGAANIGSVVMPWMLFYQQSAIADKKLAAEHYAIARYDTALGAVVTQLVMAAVLIACAATLGGRGLVLTTIGQMSEALTPLLGVGPGRFVFSAGVLGAGIVAAIVCSLALNWGLRGVTGHRHGRGQHPERSHVFYAIYLPMVAVAATIVAHWPNLVALNIGVQVMNAAMLPAVLGMLAALAVKALPAPHRPTGPYLWLVVGVCALTGGAALLGAISGMGLLE